MKIIFLYGVQLFGSEKGENHLYTKTKYWVPWGGSLDVYMDVNKLCIT
jgi:hypothetical protein